MRFWDSSALIPLVVRECRSSLVEALVAGDPDMMVWWASPVECGSAVHRLRREGVFTPTEAAQVLAGLNAVLDAANAVEPRDEMCAKALRLLGVHPLRAADALQLAAALVWTRDHPGGRDFVCLDERLRTAAAIEGFQVLPVAASLAALLGTERADAGGQAG